MGRAKPRLAAGIVNRRATRTVERRQRLGTDEEDSRSIPQGASPKHLGMDGIVEGPNPNSEFVPCPLLLTPLVFFGPFNETLRITVLTVKAPRDGTYPIKHRHAEKGIQGLGSEGFSSAGSSHSEHTLGGGLQAVTVRSEALPDARGVKFTVQPKQGAPSAP